MWVQNHQPDRWIELECPICGNDGVFDGQGYYGLGDDRKYGHRCPDCGTEIKVPTKIDGEVIGTK